MTEKIIDEVMVLVSKLSASMAAITVLSNNKEEQEAEILVELADQEYQAIRAKLREVLERKPLTHEQIDDLHGEANRGFDIESDAYFKAFRDAERAHGIGS